MEIRRETVGSTTGHARQQPSTVDAYTLDTGHGLLVTVWTYGAALIVAAVPDRHGRTENVVVRLPDISAYERTQHYVGVTLGRYARCIAEASFVLEGSTHHLTRNASRNHIHGGFFGFHRFVWKADAGRDGDELWLRLRLDRPDGDEGYPGAIAAETTYRVRERQLTFEHRATTTAPTIVDMTNHAFWNLSGSCTIDAHRLSINAERVLMVDDDLIPVGAPVEVTGTYFDFQREHPLHSVNLDHCFALNDPSWAAEVRDQASGRTMRIVTNQPGLQVYTGDKYLHPRTGLCMQTGTWPNSPRRPDFPSARLDPGETYVHRTTHTFSID